MATCSVEGCKGGVYASGMCSRHYNRKRNTGTTDDGPRARLPLEKRFWKYVDRRSEDECWDWTGSGSLGYGSIGMEGRKLLAHRVSWEIHHGAIPDTEGESHGTVVRHKCNNRLCVNPNHLMLGTQSDNVKDMWANKRNRRGNARLTEDQINQIRSDPRSSRKLAPFYGVSDAHIRSVRQGRCWHKPG